MEDALVRGRLALKEAAGRWFFSNDRPAEVVKQLTKSFVRAKSVENLAEVPLAVKDETVRKSLDSAVSALIAGDAQAGAKLAKEANVLADHAGEQAAKAASLQIMLAICACQPNLDGALSAARESAACARMLGDLRGQVVAQAVLVDVLLARGDATQAFVAAEQAVDLARSSSDTSLLAASLGVLSDVCKALKKPGSAIKFAKEALEVVKGQKNKEAPAMLAVADAHPGFTDALDAGKDAVAAYRELGDKSGEGIALIVLAFAYGDQVDAFLDDSCRVALDAAALLRAQGDRCGEALALATAARAHALASKPQDAARFGREALQAFREVDMPFGSKYAADLLCDAPFVSLSQTSARLLLDDNQVAYVEVSESATQESLDSIVSSLHQCHSSKQHKFIKVVVLQVEGSPVPSRLHSSGISTGTFLVGMRSLGVPIVSCCWGAIAGPAWGLALAGDYRISSAETTFTVPMTQPLECLAQLLGQSVATHLTMESGTMTAAGLLEMSVLHQVQLDQATAQKAAAEQAKRITNFPVFSARQTMMTMTPDAEKYLLMQ